MILLVTAFGILMSMWSLVWYRRHLEDLFKFTVHLLVHVFNLSMATVYYFRQHNPGEQRSSCRPAGWLLRSSSNGRITATTSRAYMLCFASFFFATVLLGVSAEHYNELVIYQAR